MQSKFSFFKLLPLSVFLGVVVLALFALKNIYLGLSWGFGLLAVLGTCILSGGSFRHIKLISTVASRSKPSLFPFPLFVWQLGLFVLTVISFTLVITQSQCITRLQPLEARQLFGLIETHTLILGILPWLLYSVMGVGIAYFCFYRKTRPLLHHIIIPNPAHKTSAFFHSIFSITNEFSIAMPFLFLSSTAIILWGESLSSLLGWTSPLIFSSRTVLVWFLIILFYRKKHARLMESMQEKKMPLGNRLLIYTWVFSIMLLVYQGLWALMSIFMNNSTFLMPSMTKSVLLGNLSEMELNTRLSLLIIGWWVVWIPWMASLVAKYSEGYSVGRALVNAMLIPIVVLSCTQMNINWSEIIVFFQMPFVQVISALLCMFFIAISLKQVHNFTDFSQGAMRVPVPVQKYALKKVMSSFIVRLIPYLYCSYVLGWFTTQVVEIFCGLFIFALVFSFIWVLAQSAPKISQVGTWAANSSSFDG
jgi:hypothetical protein